MFKQYIYYILISLTALLAGCHSRNGFPNEPDEKDNTPKVFLSIARMAHIDGNESVNMDTDDYEDRLHDFAMFVFNSSSGALICTYFENNIAISNKSKNFVAELTPGQRDFYFIANIPVSLLVGMTSRSAVESFLYDLRTLDPDLYLGASVNKGFPMSRVYKNQTIAPGGNIYSPQPFKPDGEDKVKLRRVVAKLEVVIDGGIASAGIQSVYFRNAALRYSLESTGNPPITPAYYADKPMKVSGNSYIYYVPEALMNTPSWGAGDHKPINYFVVKTTDGTEYEIPLITHSGTPIAGSDFLAFAKGEKPTKPEYNVLRNIHYTYNMKNLQNIEIEYRVNDWQMVVNSMYMGYGYNITIDDEGLVRIENTIDACDPHHIKLVAVNGFTFSDSSTEKNFTDPLPTANIQYSLSAIPATGAGNYLQVYYNDELVKTFSK